MRNNLHRPPMYSGVIEGRGPRYCRFVLASGQNGFAHIRRFRLFIYTLIDTPYSRIHISNCHQWANNCGTFISCPNQGR
ncbi:hypothetical protein JQC72_01505 [Polycladomyces sp. WAk]|uniref:Uncharacterized protein n=1 Tax=Polycladomyces zharkentensis TaxID=2807616 RepID=A0ABS2WF79_9BACL|nr:hypothetical protein [Polycladomyces sp. WAk]